MRLIAMACDGYSLGKETGEAGDREGALRRQHQERAFYEGSPTWVLKDV